MALLGDVGGHAEQLDRALHQLGACGSTWPDELHVVQVGDLVGGRDDVDVIDLVEPHLLAGRWTQLLGNWDSRTIGGHDFRKPGAQLPSPAAEARLASWNDAGLLQYAAAITTGARVSAVVTHAGITSDWWLDTLGGEVDGRQAVKKVNAAHLEDIHRPGEMLPIGDGKRPPGPMWTSTAELWLSWLEHAAPWPQVHGHSSSWSYHRHTWRSVRDVGGVGNVAGDEVSCHRPLEDLPEITSVLLKGGLCLSVCCLLVEPLLDVPRPQLVDAMVAESGQEVLVEPAPKTGQRRLALALDRRLPEPIGDDLGERWGTLGHVDTDVGLFAQLPKASGHLGLGPSDDLALPASTVCSSAEIKLADPLTGRRVLVQGTLSARAPGHVRLTDWDLRR